MTEQERLERLRSLVAQRDTALLRGMPASVSAIDRELAELVKDAAPAALRAVTR